LKRPLAKEIAKARPEQAKSDKGSAAFLEPHHGQPAQIEGLERELAELKAQFAQEKAKSDEAIQTLWKHGPWKLFPFTPELFSPNALSGVIAHLTVKWGGNVHDNAAVEITASSIDGLDPEYADLGHTDSSVCSKNEPGQ
jgi:hypothetical protein